MNDAGAYRSPCTTLARSGRLLFKSMLAVAIAIIALGVAHVVLGLGGATVEAFIRGGGRPST
ncbi:MAG: hypothetical protein ACLGHP_04140 [Vicinamibacteria bacterium]